MRGSCLTFCIDEFGADHLNEGAGDSSDEDENSAEEVAATEETKRRFDPEALALDGPSRGEDDAIYVDDMYGTGFSIMHPM